MYSLIGNPVKENFRLPLLILIASTYVLLFTWFLPGYFSWNANVWMGLFLLPGLIHFEKKPESWRYLYPALVSAVLLLYLPVNTFFFLTLLFVFLFFIENILGRVSPLLIILLLFISPVFGHITRVFEFPMRLWVTEKVAFALSFFGTPVHAAGNQLLLDHYEFSVDPACAGLNMLVMSLLMCLFLLNFHQQISGRKLSLWEISVLVLFTILLNLLGNFFRILLLVLFKIMPGTLLHDLTGITCLIFYVLLPLFFLVKWRFRSFPKKDFGLRWKPIKPERALKFPWIHVLCVIFLLFSFFRILDADHLIRNKKDIEIPGYQKTMLSTGILKYENKQALIYLKPTAFYAPEHDPMICWTGSGYAFKNIKKVKVKGHVIYMASLIKNRDRLYSAWWFDNGALKTVNQLEWRWQSLKEDQNFYLVNVNANSPKDLQVLVQDMLNNLNLKSIH